MLKFVKANFVGGTVTVSEPVPMQRSVYLGMGTWFKICHWYAVRFRGFPKIAYYDRQLRFTPAELGKEFAFYDEDRILTEYPGWFTRVENSDVSGNISGL